MHRSMQTNKNYFLQKSGGLGDVMWSYFYHDQRFDRSYLNVMRKLKFEQPDAHITFISATQNTQVYEFLQNNPYIDDLQVLPWSAWEDQSWKNKAAGKQEILTIGGQYYGSTEMPDKEFHLCDIEKAALENIKSQGSYVVLHPSGGAYDRDMIRPDFSVQAIMNHIIASGYNCIIIGGSSNKNSYQQKKFNYSSMNCINLIDKFTCRLHAHLTAHSKAFIGVGSCFSVIAAIFNIPSLLFYSKNMEWWVNGTPPQVGVDVISQKFRENKTQIEYFEKLSIPLQIKIRRFLENIKQNRT
jgi:ADP-heptose:LPS heptosyltransferase